MPARDGYPQGVPCWVELDTPDPEGAKRFYRAVFGWEYRAEGEALITAYLSGLPVAGMTALETGGSPEWVTYFAVEDAAGTASRFEAEGGSLVREPALSGGALVGRGMDPSGAWFGIWQAVDRFGAALVNEHGTLNWNELLTDDPEKAVLFYTVVFGLHPRTTEEEGGAGETMFESEGREVAGARAKPRSELPNHWNVYFAVDDTEAAIAAAAGNGAEVLFGPSPVDGVGIFAGFIDPWGARFMVVELANEID